jgi:hypothetical protein
MRLLFPLHIRHIPSLLKLNNQYPLSSSVYKILEYEDNAFHGIRQIRSYRERKSYFSYSISQLSNSHSDLYNKSKEHVTG